MKVMDMLIELYNLKISLKNLGECRFYILCEEILTELSYHKSFITENVVKELERQTVLHPQTDNYDFKNWFMIIAEEVGEAVRAYNNKDQKELFIELIQVMALNHRFKQNELLTKI